MTDRSTRTQTRSTLRRSASPQHVTRLLVVAPDPQVQQVVARILDRDGFRIDRVHTGEEALGMVAAHEYDLVLCEATLPGQTSGLDVLAAVKTRQPDAEVLLLADNPHLPDAVRAVKAGAFDYITKPIVTDKLRACVSAALAGSGGRNARQTATTSRLPVRGYKAVRALGSGKFGTVLLVQKNGQSYAMKVLKTGAGATADRETLQRFVREGEIIAKLALPGVVRIHELGVGPSHPRPFIVMEYVDGPDLATTIKANSLPFAQRLDILRQIAATLAAVHDAGVMHRDIKPSNVLLAGGTRVKLCDFGTARLGGSTSLTLTNEVIGTPAYMAPEMLTVGSRGVDSRTDIFSLGVVAYELLTGHLPFQADSFEDLITAILKAKPVAPRVLCPAIPGALQQLLGRMLQKDPAHRYQRARDVVADLDAISRGHGRLRRCLNGLLSGNPWR